MSERHQPDQFDHRGGMKIVPLLLREANDFVERYHRHSARTSNDGGKIRYRHGIQW
jgi:hypothetical protein